MGLQHLVAGGADLAAVLLQAGENGEIALIDDGAAVTLHVTRAGLLLIGRTAPLLLGEGAGRERDRQHGNSQEKFTHRIPSFPTAENLFPKRVSAWPGRILGIADAT